MSETMTKMTLRDEEFELLMLHADGELPTEQLTAAQTLLAESEAAQAIWQELQLARTLVREIAIDATASGQAKWARTDLSLLPGQIMRKLPNDDALHPVTEAPKESGLVAWIHSLGFGKVGLAMGLALAAVAFMVVRAGPVVDAPQSERHAEIAAVPGTNAPAAGDDNPVIIEEMDIESGTLMVHPPQEQGGATVIWHFSDNSAAQGAGGEG
jgi:hypothetical protein